MESNKDIHVMEFISSSNYLGVPVEYQELLRSEVM